MNSEEATAGQLQPDLTIVSHAKSPLHPLVEAAAANHRNFCDRHDRAEHMYMYANNSPAWTIANLMHSWQRDGGIMEPWLHGKVDAGEAERVTATATTTKVPTAKKTATTDSLTIQQEQQLLEKSSGFSVATIAVSFSHDLLHGEVESTDDRPAAVMARFELSVARQLAKSYLPSTVGVADVKYDCDSDTLRFTLDPIGQGKKRQADDLRQCIEYLSEVIGRGCFWVEYPESNLNFCQPQKAHVSVTQRSAVITEFSLESTATNSESATDQHKKTSK